MLDRINNSLTLGYAEHSNVQYVYRQLLAILLPQLNSQDLSARDVIAIVRTIADALVNFIKTTPETITQDEAREYIGQLGFIASTAEKFSQAEGNHPGVAIKALDELEMTLEILSHIAKHIPRDSHYTYWLWNRNPIINFNGDRGENLFRHAVVTQAENQRKACHALSILIDEGCDLNDPKAVELLNDAIERIEAIYKVYVSFQTRNEDGERGLTVYSFTVRLRTALPTYPIGGRSYGGVNAANLREQMHYDYLMGYAQDWYTPIVEKRMPYLTLEDSHLLTRDMVRPSLTMRILQWIGLNPHLILSLSTEQLATWIVTNVNAQAYPLLQAYSALHRQDARLTAYHWSQIVYYLERAEKSLTSEQLMELSKMPVQPNVGTGGSPLEEVKRIMEMRKDHPIIKPLCQAIEMARKAFQ